MGGQWPAIIITLVAATGNNVGKALQKEATRQLPRFSLDPAILVQYARSREWLIGLMADLGGALLMIAAFALAPVGDPPCAIQHDTGIRSATHDRYLIAEDVLECVQVSLVQPVSGVGLVSLALFSHFYLQVSQRKSTSARRLS
jgi:hypothetical protein